MCARARARPRFPTCASRAPGRERLPRLPRAWQGRRRGPVGPTRPSPRRHPPGGPARTGRGPRAGDPAPIRVVGVSRRPPPRISQDVRANIILQLLRVWLFLSSSRYETGYITARQDKPHKLWPRVLASGRFVCTILAVGSSVQARQAYTPAILVQAEGASIGPTCLRNVGSLQLGTGVAGLFAPAILTPAEDASIGRLVCTVLAVGSSGPARQAYLPPPY